MVVRENSAIESWKAMLKIQTEGATREQKKINEAVQKRENTRKNIYDIRESRLEKERSHGTLLEACKNNNLSKVIKAIYITALESNTLTDNGIFLAENMVESWIKEKGGASNIFRESAGKTYLLSRIQQIVEDTAEEETKDVEKDESADDEDKKSENENSKTEKDNENDDKSLGEKSSKKDSKTDDNEDDESTDGKSNDENDSNNDPLNDTFDDEDNSDASEDDDIEIIDDEDDENGLESDGESHGKVFDELEKEEDVKKAIELIRQRVADAEETFIKRNTEDKKQIDELLSKISDNIKTVEDMDDEDSTESKIAQENASLARRKINNITENRPATVMEKMTRILSSNIIKDNVVKEQFIDENGKVDFDSIVESSKVMYGFLETLNTLQLEKVDEAYIAKVLKEM